MEMTNNKTGKKALRKIYDLLELLEPPPKIAALNMWQKELDTNVDQELCSRPQRLESCYLVGERSKDNAVIFRLLVSQPRAVQLRCACGNQPLFDIANKVGAVPLDKDEHPEEMVTRCIVEVLSNALSKPNAPPIDPECKEILKKSTRLSHNGQIDEQYETRNPKELTSSDKHLHEINEEVRQPEQEEKRHHEESESQEEEKETREKNSHLKENEEDTGHSKESDFLDDAVEKGDHKGHYESGELTKKDKVHPGESHETGHDIFDKKVHEAAKSVEEFSEEDKEEPRDLEEMIKRHHGGINWKEQFSHPEEHHATHSSEGSDESEERGKEEKRSYKPKLNDIGQRFLGYEEKRNDQAEQRNHIDLHEEQPYSQAHKRYYGLNSFEDNMKRNHYDKTTHHEAQGSEESKEKRHFHRGSEEEEKEREINDQNEDSNEKEPNRHHLEEEEERRQHEQRKRWPSKQNPAWRYNYEQSNEDSEESKEDINRHLNERDGKERLYAKLRHHLQEEEEEKPYKHDRKDEDKRHYIGEEMVDEMKRYYPENSEQIEKRHYNDELKSHHYGENKENKRHHSEEERRPANKYGFAEDQWKNKFFDADDANILDSEEESKRSLQSKNVFPEYSDYDWWGKKQFLEDMNHGYDEKRTQPKFHKFNEKRQYDRMDELAQLLNYKKKSVEMPDFYDSEEIKKRDFNERGHLNQRPLTEEEEKELENLAIMDMELQKIAEKLTNNRQG
ncbi:secretogranin-1 [Pelodytes ibericus]